MNLDAMYARFLRSEGMWNHHCPEEGVVLATANGQPCNWCGAKQPARQA